MIMKNSFKIFISAIILSVVLFSCTKESDYSLDKSVFIEDKYNPGLPIHSDWGYNTFGAYIDRVPFTSTSNILPAKVFIHSDTLFFNLTGEYNYKRLEMRICLANLNYAEYSDLIALNNKTVNLKTDNCDVYFLSGEEKIKTKLNIIEGEFKFARVHTLKVDMELQKTILSGTFMFKTFLKDEPIAISKGRFDVNVGYENFFNY